MLALKPGTDMRRRQFIAGLGGAAAAWPLATRAQQPAMPVVGFMIAGSAEPLRQATAGFRQGLKETGYVEGQNVSIDYRFAEGQFNRFPTFASELV
jgi:putative ABC transport system substrate-binding protein